MSQNQPTTEMPPDPTRNNKLPTQSAVAEKLPTPLDSSVQVQARATAQPLPPSTAVGSGSYASHVAPSTIMGQQQASYPTQQTYAGGVVRPQHPAGIRAMGGGAISAPGGVSGAGLMLTMPNSAGTPDSLSSALNMVSHDQDDSVFSPSGVDDERMKIIEKVGKGPLS